MKAGSGVTTARYDDAVALDEQLDHHERHPPALRGLHPGARPPGRVAPPHRRPRRGRRRGRHQRHAAGPGQRRRRARRVLDRRRRRRRPCSPRPRPPPATGRLGVGRHRRLGRPSGSGPWRPAAGAGRSPPPRWPRDAVPRDEPVDPGLAKDRATSSCRRGRRAATAPPSGGPSTACCRPSTSPPARAWTAAAAAQAAAEGVPDRAAAVEALARVRPRRRPWCRPPPRAPHWREVYVAGAGRRHAARGLHRPAVPRRRRPRGRRLQDRPPARRAVAGGPPAATTAARGRPTPWPSSGSPRSAWPGVCSCSARRRGPGSGEVADLRVAMAEIDDELARSAPLVR